MIAWYRRRRIRRIARNTSAGLQGRFGRKDFYSAAELDEVIASIGMNRNEREWAYAMFSNEEVCNGFLSRIGSGSTAATLRFFMGGVLFGSGGATGYDSSWNRFHDYDNEVLGGLQHLGPSSADSSGGGWSDDGGHDGGSDGGGSE